MSFFFIVLFWNNLRHKNPKWWMLNGNLAMTYVYYYEIYEMKIMSWIQVCLLFFFISSVLFVCRLVLMMVVPWCSLKQKNQNQKIKIHIHGEMLSHFHYSSNDLRKCMYVLKWEHASCLLPVTMSTNERTE